MALPESLYADTILVNGTVITVDDTRPTAEAVALKGDRILYVGSNDEVRQCAGRSTRVIDAGGKTVLPGFIEPHTHFMSFGIRLGMVNVRTPPNNSIEDVLARIRERAATTPKGQWIEAQGLRAHRHRGEALAHPGRARRRGARQPAGHHLPLVPRVDGQ